MSRLSQSWIKLEKYIKKPSIHKKSDIAFLFCTWSQRWDLRCVISICGFNFPSGEKITLRKYFCVRVTDCPLITSRSPASTWMWLMKSVILTFGPDQTTVRGGDFLSNMKFPNWIRFSFCVFHLGLNTLGKVGNWPNEPPPRPEMDRNL